MIISMLGLGLVAMPTGILASGFSEKMREREAMFKAMVDAKVADGTLSEREKVELKLKARELGLGRLQEKDMEQAEVDALKRAQAEADDIRAKVQSVPVETPVVAADLLAVDVAYATMPLSDFENLLQQIDTLSAHEKSRIMARLAADMEQRFSPKA
jgi:hypothetical protein